MLNTRSAAYTNRSPSPAEPNSVSASMSRTHGVSPSDIGKPSISDTNKSGDRKATISNATSKPRPGSAPPSKSSQSPNTVSNSSPSNQRQEQLSLYDDRSFQNSQRPSDMSIVYTDLCVQSLDDEEIIVSDDCDLDGTLLEVYILWSSLFETTFRLICIDFRGRKRAILIRPTRR